MNGYLEQYHNISYSANKHYASAPDKGSESKQTLCKWKARRNLSCMLLLFPAGKNSSYILGFLGYRAFIYTLCKSLI